MDWYSLFLSVTFAAPRPPPPVTLGLSCCRRAVVTVMCICSRRARCRLSSSSVNGWVDVSSWVVVVPTLLLLSSFCLVVVDCPLTPCLVIFRCIWVCCWCPFFCVKAGPDSTTRGPSRCLDRCSRCLPTCRCRGRLVLAIPLDAFGLRQMPLLSIAHMLLGFLLCLSASLCVLCLVSCVLSLVSSVLCLPSGLCFVACALWPVP